jgi:hypothetical protein
MNGVMTTEEVLSQSRAGDHFVHAYQDADTLANTVCHFITHQLGASEATLIIATEAHILAISSKLINQGVDIAQMTLSGQLTMLDAAELLSCFMREEKPDATLFVETIEEILGRILSKHDSVRAYGEMVDILWQNNERQAAAVLEQYWNTLLKKHPFSLLCAYQLDNLDAKNYHDAIDSVCETHTHFLPAQDTYQLEKAVAEASKCVMGVDLSNMIKCISALSQPATAMPPSQASLLYLSKTMPTEMEAILRQVRMNLEAGSNI